MESYISKVTSAGQLTLPKKVRKGLGLKGSEYVEVALLGKAVVIRRLREEDELLRWAILLSMPLSSPSPDKSI